MRLASHSAARVAAKLTLGIPRQSLGLGQFGYIVEYDENADWKDITKAHGVRDLHDAPQTQTEVQEDADSDATVVHTDSPPSLHVDSFSYMVPQRRAPPKL